MPDGIEYTFPTTSPVTMDPCEYILLVKDLAAFSSRYSPPVGVHIYEWDSGGLNNGGEKLELSKPGNLDIIRYYIRVDRINYSDGSQHENFTGFDPWPTEPDGTGKSLNRIIWGDYGNDPTNWQAADPSPNS